MAEAKQTLANVRREGIGLVHNRIRDAGLCEAGGVDRLLRVEAEKPPRTPRTAEAAPKR